MYPFLCRKVLSKGEERGIKKIQIFTADEWKWRLIDTIKDKENINVAIKTAMSDEDFRKNGKEVNAIIQKCFKNRYFPDKIDESKILAEAKNFLSEEFKAEIILDPSEDSQGNKKKAMPRKPGIHIDFK